MNLFELFVKIGVDDQASKKISDIAKNLGNGIKTAAKVGLAAVTTAATGVTALATSAIKNFAEYEQLVGGSELMFGKAFDTVQRNAQDAYKTVQMSQNEYLQQVNGFATGLKTALGGNEQAAADLAHRIVQAEADIVAATGNTAENVQNAFNGIMKSNFTMLDNLQIGITPTKEGFQEVIDKVNEWNSANGKATKYQMGNLADMQSALVDYIDMVGMSGYAQNEAAGTIQGSLAMTKAAWSNLLTGIADDTADFDSMIDNLIESVGAFGSNVMPRAEQALGGVVKLIDGLLPKIVESIPKFISSYAPKLIQAGANVLKSLVRGIKNNAKTMVNAAKDIVIELIDEIPDLIPDVIDAGVELLSGLVSAVPDVAAKIFKSMPKIIESVVKGLVKGTAKIVKAFTNIFVTSTDKSEETIKSFTKNLSSFESFFDTLSNIEEKTVDYSKALSRTGKTISDIDAAISTAENNITQILKKALSSQQSLREEDLKNIQKYNDQIREMEAEKVSIYRDAQLAEYRKTMLDIGEMGTADIAKALSGAQSALDAANQAVEDAYTNRLTYIENIHKASGTIGTVDYKNDLAAAKAERDEMLRQNEDLYNQTLLVLENRTGQLADLSIEQFDTLNNAISTYYAELDKYTELARKYLGVTGSNIDLMQFAKENAWLLDTMGLSDETTGKFVERLNQIDYEAANAFISMQAHLANAGVEIDEESQKTVSTILGAFREMPGEMGDASREGMMALIDGLENEIPELKNAGEMTADEIIRAIEDHLKNSEIDVQINSRAAVGVDGSHANGLSYVPYDGYIAELHRGERVLTKQEAEKYSGWPGGNITININGSKYQDEESVANAVAEAIQDLMDRRLAAYA